MFAPLTPLTTASAAWPGPRARRRYLECAGFLIVWLWCGFQFRLSDNAFLWLGVPLMLVFQWAVARRPIAQLWVRDATALPFDQITIAIACFFAVAATVAASHLQPVNAESLAALYAPALVGSYLAAASIRRQISHNLVRGLVPAAVGMAIGVAVMAYFAKVASHPLTFPITRVPVLGAHLLVMFCGMFVVEEVVFRGALDPHVAIGETKTAQWTSAVFVSALWGLWHVPVNHCSTLSEIWVATSSRAPSLIAECVAIGVWQSFAARRSRTLLLPVLAHAVIDAYRNVLFSL